MQKQKIWTNIRNRKSRWSILLVAYLILLAAAVPVGALNVLLGVTTLIFLFWTIDKALQKDWFIVVILILMLMWVMWLILTTTAPPFGFRAAMFSDARTSQYVTEVESLVSNGAPVGGRPCISAAHYNEDIATTRFSNVPLCSLQRKDFYVENASQYPSLRWVYLRPAWESSGEVPVMLFRMEYGLLPTCVNNMSGDSWGERVWLCLWSANRWPEASEIIWK